MTDAADFAPQTVTVDGAPFAYYEAGQGEPLIMIHGGGPGASGMSNYRRNAAALAKTNRVIVIDLPGYGRSPVRPYGREGIYDSFADIVLAFMDALKIDKASFVGNSLGGGTTLSLALDHPERVNRMILMGPGGSLSISPTPTEGLMRMFTFYDGEGPTLEKLERVIDLLVYDRSMITPDLVQERLEAATRPDVIANPPLRGRGAVPADDLWRRPLYTLQHPTLIIWGRDDRVLPLDASLVLLKALPNADLHVMPKCGHWVQWEKADAFNDLVSGFLART